ncbi:MAG: hypothetical protein AB1755_04570 [Candidatus Omnitrophota bacterium]
MAKLDPLLNIVKCMFGLFLIPVVYAITHALVAELSGLSNTNLSYFYGGVICYLILHLFIFKPTKVYDKGKEISQEGSKAFSSFFEVAPHIFPIFSIIVFVIYFLTSLFYNNPNLLNYFLLLFSFSATLHLVLTAEEMRNVEDGKNAIINYLFSFSLIYLLNFFLIALLLSLVMKEFAFLDVAKDTFSIIKTFYSAVFGQLFG